MIENETRQETRRRRIGQRRHRWHIPSLELLLLLLLMLDG